MKILMTFLASFLAFSQSYALDERYHPETVYDNQPVEYVRQPVQYGREPVAYCPDAVDYSREPLAYCCDPLVRNQFSYIKLGLGACPEDHGNIGPVFGFGKRWKNDCTSIDVSFTWSKGGKNEYLSYVKGLYLFHLTPYAANGWYAGGGLSIGNLNQIRAPKFSGLMGELAVGYEFLCQQSIRPFVEFDFSHGLLGFDSHHKLHGFNPFLSLCAGFGF